MKHFIINEAPYRQVLYSRWYDMRDRCNNSNNPHYINYGGRGIKVCKEWDNSQWGFICFYGWAMQEGFHPSLSLDRIDVNKGYLPNNCRWATAWEQAQNKRNSIQIYDNGEYISLYNYCIKHKDTNPYRKVREYIKIFIPPYIALYYDFQLDYLSKTWVKSNKHKLYWILDAILREHPNLIEDNNISLNTYIHNYLSPYIIRED